MAKKPPDDYDRWREAAAAVTKTDNPLKVPYDVFLKEAGQAAAFLDTYWKSTPDRPGVSRVQRRLPRGTAEEIRSLVAATQIAQTRLLLIVDPVVADKGERARFLVDELESHIDFLLDDDVEEPADAQLAQLKDFHAQDGQRSAALVQALRDYATLARSLKDRLVEMDEEFDPKWIDEAMALAGELVKTPAPEGAALSKDAVEATRTRNRFLVLLSGKVAAVRKAAAHVFRRFPEIVREASSAYERRRRAAARRAKLAEQPKPGGSAPTEKPA